MEEEVDNCTTRQHLEAFLACGCLPYSVRTQTNDTHPCSQEQLRCAYDKVDSSQCVHKCNGMMVTSYSKSDIDGELEDYIPLEVAAYNKYKKRFKPKTSSGIEGYQWENRLRFV